MEGEPRSLRFTFEFAPNDFLHDVKLVKDFEYQSRKDGPGSLVSTPVPVKWKSKKQDLTNGLLEAAVELYNAEEALQLKSGDKVVDVVDREALWQHEKLREKLVKQDEGEEGQPSFFNWFGFRGAIDHAVAKQARQNGAEAEDDEDEDEHEDDVDEMLAVEIFPAGEELAITLAEELWTDAMDYFMSAQEEGDSFAGIDDDEEDGGKGAEDEDEDVPDLVDAGQEEADRPRKKQRKG